MPGMGDTTARYFRDKLAMRVQAQTRASWCPSSCTLLNHAQIADFLERMPPPWLVKPRSEAATVGIKKIENAEGLWSAPRKPGRPPILLPHEQFIPGDVHHVDALVSERQVVFAEAHHYGTPPFNVVHEGGIFTTRTIRDETARRLRALNAEVLGVLGFVRGAVHAEFIRSHADGRFYFLETGARVGGAHIPSLVDAATGVNLWREWAKIEIAGGDYPYSPPAPRLDYGGLIISLARQDQPDTSAYADPEIAWRLSLHHHAGLVVVSKDPGRVTTLLDEYTNRFYQDFFATQPAPDTPTS